MTAHALEALLWPKQPLSATDSETALTELCKHILGDGLPMDLSAYIAKGRSSARSMAWKLLLGVSETPAKEYLDLVQLGASAVNDKIRNDTYAILTVPQHNQAKLPAQIPYPRHRFDLP